MFTIIIIDYNSISYYIDGGGQKYSLVHKKLVKGLVVISNTEHAVDYQSDKILLGMLDVLQLMYPIRKIDETKEYDMYISKTSNK